MTGFDALWLLGVVAVGTASAVGLRRSRVRERKTDPRLGAPERDDGGCSRSAISRRGRWPAHVDRRLVLAARGRQGRTRRPQRRRQDVDAARCSRARRRRPAGVVLRPDAARLPPPGPARRGARGSTAPRSSHVLSGRGLDAAAPTARGAAHADRRRPVAAQRRARSRNAEEAFRDAGGYAAEVRGAPHRGRARARRRPARPADQRAVGWRAAPGRARAHPVRGQRPPAARRADEPPRRRRQGVAHGVPAHVPRRAARRQPRPRAARPGDHARAAPRRRRAHRVPRHLLAVPRRARRPTRSAAPKLATRQDAEIDRLADARRLDARARPRSGPAPRRRSTPRREAATRARSRGREGRAHAARCSSPIRRARAASCSRSTTSPRRSAARSCSRTSTFDVGRGERLLVLGLNGAGKTTLLRIARRRARGRARRGRLGHQVSIGYYAQEHEGITRGPRRARAPPRAVAARADQ